jgi:hypothetical protein
LSWGGETQALIYNPKTKKVIAINAMGVAPTGATVEFFKSKGYAFPPEYGPLAATTPGTVGGLCYMLSEFGTMSLKQVLLPAMQLAAGYPIDAQTANSMEKGKEMIKGWPYSKAVFLTHPGEKREAPEAGEIFVQKDLLNTLTKLVEAETAALKNKKSRKEAIMAATGAKPVWYRGATALYSPAAVPAIEGMGFSIAGYSLNADMGASLPAEAVTYRMRQAKDGDVIIAHTNQPNRPSGAGVIAGVRALLDQDVRFVRLDALTQSVASM